MSSGPLLSGADVGTVHERRIARVGVVLWPSFLAAAVLCGVVFSVVDPSALHGFAQQPLGWSDSSVYTLGFFLFWAVSAAASATSQWLLREGGR